jgi:FkbM family methyltransferase
MLAYIKNQIFTRFPVIERLLITTPWLYRFYRAIAHIRLYFRAKYLQRHPIIEMLKSREFYAKNKDRIETVMTWLADEESKNTYRKMIEFRQSYNTRNFYYHGRLNQYFRTNFIHYNKHEVLLDCGAYRGDTIHNFLTLPPYPPPPHTFQIIALEPEIFNFQLLHKLYKGNNSIKIINAGAYKMDGTISFGGDSSTGSIGKGQTMITVQKIDNLECAECITFIKMDIEGAEMDALLGAEQTIKNKKPRLAICIYHSDEDMIRLAELIHSWVPEYKLYVRQHTKYCTAETVLYACLHQDNITVQ